MIIKEVEKNEEINICNEFLKKLIIDEKKYDDNINDQIIINDYYQKVCNDNNKLFIAIIDNNVIGYIYIKISDPKQNSDIYKESFIDAIYVENNYRNNGVATNLIEKAKEFSKEKGAKKISINALKDNKVALELYYKLGFNDFSVKLKQDL